jgi:hypothetical protein
VTGNPLIGSSFGGDEILAKRDEGGRGSVYQARHIPFNRIVAITLLTKELFARLADFESAKLLAGRTPDAKAETVPARGMS